MQSLPLEMVQRARNSRRETITEELRRRLRATCAGMTEDVFFDMVERMAEIQLKYELIERRPAD